MFKRNSLKAITMIWCKKNSGDNLGFKFDEV
jgi:hypothetical protein